MRFLVIFIFIISSSIANEVPKIKNVVINKEPKMYNNIVFLDSNKKFIKLSDYEGNLISKGKFMPPVIFDICSDDFFFRFSFALL